MKLLSLCLFLSLVSSSALAAPTFGPEIEFRGKRHFPAAACGLTLYSSHKLMEIGLPLKFGGLVLWPFLDHSGEKRSFAEKADLTAMALGSGLSGAVMVCSIARPISNRAYDKKLQDRLEQLCADGHCRLKIETRKVWWDKKPFQDFKVSYPQGFYVTFSHDSAVIEVNASPLKTELLEQNLGLLQKDVFDLLRGLGLKPPRFDGPWNGGHVHIGVRESFRDLREVRNFLADLYAHPELGQGILLEDPIEGPSVAADGGRSLRKVIADLDQILASHPNAGISREMANWLEEHLPKKAGQGISFNKKYATLELRFIRSQKSADELLRLFRLFEGRIGFLQKQKGLVPLAEAPLKRESVAERLRKFRVYVEEAGLPWEEYRGLAPATREMQMNDMGSRCMTFFGKLFK